jgi:hypothetical protein
MNNPKIMTFVDTYLYWLQQQPRKDGTHEIKYPGFRPASLVNAALGGKPGELPAIKVADPTQHLNRLLWEVMRTGNAELPIPSQVVEGFSVCGNHGRGFYGEFHNSFKRGQLLSPDIEYPPALVVPTPDGGTRWTRLPEHGMEQLYHFIYHLRYLMVYLAEHPIGKKTGTSTNEVTQMLTKLPRRAAFVRSGDDIGVIYTDDVLPSVSGIELAARLAFIQAQTRQKYCKPKQDVEAAAESSQPHTPISRSEVI